MMNAGIYDGDLLIVDKSIDSRNFSTVIANVNEELVVKTLIKGKGTSYLTSGSKNILDKINLSENLDCLQMLRERKLKSSGMRKKRKGATFIMEKTNLVFHSMP